MATAVIYILIFSLIFDQGGKGFLDEAVKPDPPPPRTLSRKGISLGQNDTTLVNMFSWPYGPAESVRYLNDHRFYVMLCYIRLC